MSVHYILPNPTLPIRDHSTPHYTLQFVLDDVKLTQNFTHISDSSNNFLYNVSVFSIENLSNTRHSFKILSTSNLDGMSPLFDYAIYRSVPCPSGSFFILISCPIQFRRQLNDLYEEGRREAKIYKLWPNNRNHSRSAGLCCNHHLGSLVPPAMEASSTINNQKIQQTTFQVHYRPLHSRPTTIDVTSLRRLHSQYSRSPSQSCKVRSCLE